MYLIVNNTFLDPLDPLDPLDLGICDGGALIVVGTHNARGIVQVQYSTERKVAVHFAGRTVFLLDYPVSPSDVMRIIQVICTVVRHKTDDIYRVLARIYPPE